MVYVEEKVRAFLNSYKECSFRSDPLTNMAATGNSYF